MSCPVCNSPDSNSPTGSWCNTCGYQSPCPCWKGDWKACMDYMNEKRIKSGYRPLAGKCCCDICKIPVCELDPVQRLALARGEQ